jgi:hypothetical protein
MEASEFSEQEASEGGVCTVPMSAWTLSGHDWVAFVNSLDAQNFKALNFRDFNPANAHIVPCTLRSCKLPSRPARRCL